VDLCYLIQSLNFWSWAINHRESGGLEFAVIFNESQVSPHCMDLQTTEKEYGFS
jgi:hypothetical protein